MEKEILPLLINGHYTDWFFNVFITNFTLAIKNNLSLLLLFAITWSKIAKKTKNTWDDRLSGWLVNTLTGFKKPKKEGEAK